jgi:hypothetical protein
MLIIIYFLTLVINKFQLVKYPLKTKFFEGNLQTQINL